MEPNHKNTLLKAFILKLQGQTLFTWIVSLFKACIIVCALLGVGITYWFQHPLDNDQKTILIPKGTSLNQIASLLKEEKLISSSLLFKVSVIATGKARGLKAGEYLVPPTVSPAQLISILKSGEVMLHSVTLIEGETSHHFTEKLRDNPYFSGNCEVPAEGCLLPDTYHFARGTNRQGILNHMQKAMTCALDSLGGTSLSRNELLTLASIVEKETCLPYERPLVAAVFLNRLKKDMPLQADPTVVYALTKGECDLGRALCRKDLQLECPYNTYTQKGLPPSPIANPSLASLKAVIEPSNVDFLYFVADGSGGHIFAASFEDHQKNHAAWRIKRKELNDAK